MSGGAMLFLDSREALSGAKRILGRKFLDIEKVALTPEACHLLDKIGVPYRTPEEFYDVGDLWKIEVENRERLYRWCDRADALLSEEVPEIGRLGLRPARYNIYMWYLLTNTLASRQHALERTLTGLAPRRIYVPGMVRDQISRDLYFLYESVDVYLLQALSAVRSVPCQIVSRGKRPRLAWRQSLGGLARWAKRLPRRWLKLPAGMQETLRSLRAGTAPALWILWPGYDVMPVASEAKKRGVFELIEWTPEDMLKDGCSIELREKCARVWKSIGTDTRFLRLLRQSEIDWFPILEARLRFFFTRCVPEIIQLARCTIDFLNSKSSLVILKANEMDYRDLCVSDIALRHGVPVVTYQHGGTVGYCEGHPLMPLAHWGTGKEERYFFLTYGDGVSEYCERARVAYPALAAQPIPVGSAALEMTARSRPSRGDACRRLGVNPEHSVVIYAPTGYYGNTQYPMLYRDTEYFTLQRRILELFARVGKHRYIVKRYPWGLVGPKEPLPDVVRSFDGPAIRVVKGVPFSEAMWAADLLVVDYPSTTLLQALLTHKQIIVLADERHARLLPEAKELLLRRVRLAETAEEFLEKLETTLRRECFPELTDPDETFLNRYGVHLRDGRSAARAHDFLLELVKGERARETG